MVRQGDSGSGSHWESTTSLSLGLKLSEGLTGARAAVSKAARPRGCHVNAGCWPEASLPPHMGLSARFDVLLR